MRDLTPDSLNSSKFDPLQFKSPTHFLGSFHLRNLHDLKTGIILQDSKATRHNESLLNYTQLSECRLCQRTVQYRITVCWSTGHSQSPNNELLKNNGGICHPRQIVFPSESQKLPRQSPQLGNRGKYTPSRASPFQTMELAIGSIMKDIF